MDLRTKLTILADAAKYDASCASSGSRRANINQGLGNSEGMGICHSFTPDGRCVSLLKILLTNYCIYDCLYCVNRISSDTQRARFATEEVVRLTLDFYRRNYIEGLFLSSGIVQSPDHTMEQVAEIARSLREDHQFHGYIHLKTVPGSSQELIDLAGRYADRLSVNVELPTDRDLKRLAPEKKLVQIEGTMQSIRERVDAAKSDRRSKNQPNSFAPAGQSTQMVVGATDTADSEILATSARLYENYRLRRVYYSAYSPIPHADGRLPGKTPPLVREHRLYQADWLMRFYGFDATELTTESSRNLDLELDPKLAWALRHREQFPVDLNTASREMLLRIPGIGARNVQRLLTVRRHHRLRLIDLVRLRIALKRARPFIVTADHNPANRLIDRIDLPSTFKADSRQLMLFEATAGAQTGEL